MLTLWVGDPCARPMVTECLSKPILVLFICSWATSCISRELSFSSSEMMDSQTDGQWSPFPIQLRCNLSLKVFVFTSFRHYGMGRIFLWGVTFENCFVFLLFLRPSWLVYFPWLKPAFVPTNRHHMVLQHAPPPVYQGHLMPLRFTASIKLTAGKPCIFRARLFDCIWTGPRSVVKNGDNVVQSFF